MIVGARTQRKGGGSGRPGHSVGTQEAGIGNQYPTLFQDKARSSQVLCDWAVSALATSRALSLSFPTVNGPDKICFAKSTLG